jgi:mono/diheme cytochrome c family protein
MQDILLADPGGSAVTNKMRWIAAIWIAVLAVACRQQNAQNASAQSTAAKPATASVISAETASTIQRISLPHYAPLNLPPGPGKDVFAAACISCHSTRYITTQPPMNQSQWTAEVHKMIKTYGAPVAEEQVGPTVQYIMATKEAGGPGQTWEAITPEPAHPMSEIPQPNLANSAQLIQRGMPIFQKSCLPCHGPQGHGDGPTAAVLLPKPEDFGHARFEDRLIAYTIENGVRGTGMPSFANYSRDDVDALVAVVQSLTPSADVNPPAAQPKDLSQGKTIFAANCASCHGATGSGDGIAAAPLARPPANFHLKQPLQASALEIIANGIPGTTMPGWKTKLNETEQSAVADYVRSLYGDHPQK